MLCSADACDQVEPTFDAYNNEVSKQTRTVSRIFEFKTVLRGAMFLHEAQEALCIKALPALNFILEMMSSTFVLALKLILSL